MMIKDEDIGVIDKIEWLYDETHKTKVSLKSCDGKLFIDARKWNKWANEDQFRATSKGLMVEASQWYKIIDMVNQLLIKNQINIT